MDKGNLLTLTQLIKLKQLSRRLVLTNHKKTLYSQTGIRTSAARGRGIEFEEVRHYLPGDDIRTMDWRVTARSGEPYTKVFREERERPVFLLLDYRASMYFGTKVTFKSALGANAAALIAWASIQQGDCVGSIIFKESDSLYVKSNKGTQGIMPIFNAFVDHHQIPEIDPKKSLKGITHTLKQMVRITHSGSLIFLISDFTDFNEQVFKLFYPLRQKSELVFIFVYDPLEKEPPPPGCYAVTNGKQSFYFDTSNDQIRNNYREHFEKRYEYVKQFCKKNNICFISLATNESLNKIFFALEFYR